MKLTRNRMTSIAVVSLLAVVSMSACSGRGSRPDGPQTLAPSDWSGSIQSEMDVRYHPTVGTKGMVVCDDRVAGSWGAEVLKRGGNAIDAAVATAFAMSVTRPHYASLGGGGFMVYCPKPGASGPSACKIIDYREMAPSAATRDMYIPKSGDGKADPKLSQDGALASGVPGVTSGLLTALEEFGSKPRQELLTRPIELARRGYVFSERQESGAYDRWNAFNAEAKRLFGCQPTKATRAATGKAAGSDLAAFKSDRSDKSDDKLAASAKLAPSQSGGDSLQPCPVGSIVKQPDLARTLEAISSRGAKGFYEGEVARKIVAGLKAAGGIITSEDMAAYRAKSREPVVGHFKGMEIVTMPPPSAGGALIVQMLGYMERAEKQGALAKGWGSAETIHAMAHAMQLSFADRAYHFGDPDQVPIPIARLISKDYLDKRWKTFNPGKVNYPTAAGDVTIEGANTTHFSVIDSEGNAVSVTTTINDYFGSGFVPPGTGVMMNNEMDDFSVQPGVPNMFGLAGASGANEANAVGPRKRPLSSMSPTIVRDAKGNARIVIGASGGPTITTGVFQAIFMRLQFGLSIADAVGNPRFHHQWKPNELRMERNGFAPETKERLHDMGYTVKEVKALTKLHAIERFPATGRVWGVADCRGEGAAVAE